MSRFRRDALQGFLSTLLGPVTAGTAEERSRDRYRRIAVSTGTGLAARALGLIVSAATVPVVLSYLGKLHFGLWAAATSVIAWVGVLNFGVMNGLVNALAESYGSDDREAANQYVSSAFAILLSIVALTLFVYLLFGSQIRWNDILSVRDGVAPEVVDHSVEAAFAALLVALPFSIVPQIYAAYQKSYISNVVSIIAATLTFVALLAGARSGASVSMMVFLFGGVGGVVAATNLVVLTRYEMPWLRLTFRSVSVPAIRRLLRSSIPLFLFDAAALIVNQVQLVILARNASLADVTEFSVLYRVYLLVISVIWLGTSAFVPSFREAEERGDRQWVQRSFVHMLGARVILSVMGAAVLVLFGNDVLRLWLGADAVAFGREVWVALAILLVSSVWVTSFADLLKILDRPWAVVFLVIGNAVITSVLTHRLLPAWGILGVVLATTAVSTTILSWAMPLLAWSQVGIRPWISLPRRARPEAR